MPCCARMHLGKLLPMELLGISALLGTFVFIEAMNLTTLKFRMLALQHEAEPPRCIVSTVEMLRWTNFIVIEETSNQWKSEELYNFNDSHKHFTVPSDPDKIDILHILDQLETRRRNNFIIFCSDLCLRTFLTVANGYDDYNNQQGYFSWANKYLLLSTSSKPLNLATSIGFVNNVLIFTENRSFGSRTFVLKTAIGQNVNPRFVQVGTCRKQQLFNSSELYPNLAFGLNRRNFKISTNIWAPFVGRIKENSTIRYYGFCVEILQSLSNVLNFTYELHEPEDGEWGALENGRWTGLVGDLAYKRADMVFAPLSRTIYREEAISFSSQPFYVETIQAVYEKPGERDKSWQVFLPLRWEVWALFCVSILVGSLNLYLLDNVFNERCGTSFRDYVLMAFGSSLSQGSDYLPKWQSGRIFWSFWCFFCMLILYTYSGNLIAFLTVTLANTPFRTFGELLENNEYTFGIMGGTSNIDYFKNSKNQPFSGMWTRVKEFNKSDPEVLSKDHNRHIQKIYKEKYVYVLDRTTAELLSAEDCSVAVLPDQLGRKSFYSVAFRKNSAYQQLIGEIIIKMGSTGLLQAWKMRNWPTSSLCSAGVTDTGTTARVRDLYGAFLILFIMLALSVVLLTLEISYQYVFRMKISCLKFRNECKTS